MTAMFVKVTVHLLTVKVRWWDSCVGRFAMSFLLSTGIVICVMSLWSCCVYIGAFENWLPQFALTITLACVTALLYSGHFCDPQVRDRLRLSDIVTRRNSSSEALHPTPTVDVESSSRSCTSPRGSLKQVPS